LSTYARATERAVDLDKKVEGQLNDLKLGSRKEILSKLRAYLINRTSEINTYNNVIGNLRISPSKAPGVSIINYGPTIDKGATEEHFQFDSGARLCFGLAFRERSSNDCEIVSYRFHYHLANGNAIEFLRFDLNPDAHQEPLLEPRCHLHPGLEHVRLPIVALTPWEVLDRIFFVIESQFRTRNQ
jgi:hypothetical protein